MEQYSDTVRARLSPDAKAAAEAVLAKLGLGHTEAIRLFYQQIILHNGLPFEVKIPTAQTQMAMEEAQQGKNLRRHKTIAGFAKSLGLE